MTANSDFQSNPHFITQDMCNIAANMLPGLLHELLRKLELSGRPFQGVLRIDANMGELQFSRDCGGNQERYGAMATKKENLVNYTGLPNSGMVAVDFATVDADDVKWEGSVHAEGITVSFSGVEEHVDRFIASTVLNFLIMLKNFFLGVVGPATSTSAYGDPIAADDIVGQIKFRRLPAGVRKLFPNTVEQPTEDYVTNAIIGSGLDLET